MPRRITRRGSRGWVRMSVCGIRCPRAPVPPSRFKRRRDTRLRCSGFFGARMHITQDVIDDDMVAADAVGIFDSGVGGLSVLRTVRRELPNEHLLYVGDSGYAPYGDRSSAFVVQRAIAVTEFL